VYGCIVLSYGLQVCGPKWITKKTLNLLNELYWFVDVTYSKNNQMITANFRNKESKFIVLRENSEWEYCLYLPMLII
jgi:hypothetical protein